MSLPDVETFADRPVTTQPRLMWPIAFRLIAAAWFLANVLYLAVRNRGTSFLLMDLLAMSAVMVIPSLVIAIGLIRRGEWAAWLAVCGDCTIAVVGLGAVLGGLSPYAYGEPKGFTIWDGSLLAIGASSLLEGAYLLRKLGKPWTSLALYLPVAGICSCIGWGMGLLGD